MRISKGHSFSHLFDEERKHHGRFNGCFASTTYPEQRSFSSRSIKRFCKEKGIKRRGIVSNEQLDDAVSY